MVWILRPFLRNKTRNKNKDTIDSILDPDQSNFRRQNTILIIITALILLALVLWILPRFGVNLLALSQKIIPVISSLRGILPF